ncbi:ribonuclease H-like domain-containing protein [Tanacetum coccineum]
MLVHLVGPKLGRSRQHQALSLHDAKPILLVQRFSSASPSFNNGQVHKFALQSDLEQIHEDDLEAMDLKWQLSLLSVRENKYYQRTCKKIFINGNDIAGYDKSKVECYNYHKLGHFARECRAPRSKEGFDWSDMAGRTSSDKHGSNGIFKLRGCQMKEQDESKPKSEKKTVIPTAAKKDFAKLENHKKPFKKSVRYAEMYRSL